MILVLKVMLTVLLLVALLSVTAARKFVIGRYVPNDNSARFNPGRIL